MVSGPDFTCGVAANPADVIFCWGDFETTSTEWEGFPQKESIVELAAGESFICARTPTGDVWCLTKDTTDDAPPTSKDFWVTDSPVKVEDYKFKAISAGKDAICGILWDDTIACWSVTDVNDHDRILDSPAGTYKQLSVGSGHACAVRKNKGIVVCWGANSWSEWATVQALPGTFESVSAGNQHTCGIRPDGDVECWGNNGSGQLNAPEF